MIQFLVGKMKAGLRPLLLILLAIGLIRSGKRLSAQTFTLPQDILFYEIDTTQEPYRFRLARIDAQTLELSTFYEGDGVPIYPIRWSPSGKMLAGIVNRSRLFNEICFYGSGGKPMNCLEEKIDNDSPRGGGIASLDFNVSWSKDETSLYFTTFRNDTADGNYRFLQADIASGKTTHTLYSGNAYTRYLLFSWTPTADALIEGAQDIYRTNEGYPINFIQLDPSNQKQPLVIPFRKEIKTTEADLQPEKELEIRDLSNQGHFYLPCALSPLGNYVAAIDSNSFNPVSFALLDKRGNILREMRRVNEIPIPRSCPVWTPDETAFYFSADIVQYGEIRQSRIFKYTLATQGSSIFYDGDVILPGIVPMKVSEDGNYLVSVTQKYNPEENLPKGASSYPYVLIVIGPNNVVQFLGNPHKHNYLPLWVPPLKN